MGAVGMGRDYRTPAGYFSKQLGAFTFLKLLGAFTSLKPP